MEEKSINKGINKGHDNLIPIKKGERLNPNGRPKGQRNYATIYKEALIKIGEANNKTPEEIENMMNEVGLKNALKGDYRFYKDTQDRIHGQAVSKIEAAVETKDSGLTEEQKQQLLKMIK